MSLPIQFSSRHVLVVSPCGALLDEAALKRGVEALHSIGYAVHVPASVYLRHQRFAGDDDQRMASLQQALMPGHGEPPVMVMASRGGYGASRLLHGVDWSAMAQAMRRNGRVLCGHSDITAIQLALLAAGAPVQGLLHGPMVCFDFGQSMGVDPTTFAYFDAATRLGRVEVAWLCPGFDNLVLHGPVWGGNLSLICHVLGTPFWPAIDGGILVLEDVNEPVYKLERMLLQLLHAGVLHRQKALVLGQFHPPVPVEHDQGYNFDVMVAYLQSLLPCPVLTQFPFGHCTPKACWYQGLLGSLTLCKDSGQAVLEQHAHTTLYSTTATMG